MECKHLNSSHRQSASRSHASNAVCATFADVLGFATRGQYITANQLQLCSAHLFVWVCSLTWGSVSSFT